MANVKDQATEDLYTAAAPASEPPDGDYGRQRATCRHCGAVCEVDTFAGAPCPECELPDAFVIHRPVAGKLSVAFGVVFGVVVGAAFGGAPGAVLGGVAGYVAARPSLHA